MILVYRDGQVWDELPSCFFLINPKLPCSVYNYLKHLYTFGILITFSLICIELNINFASFAITFSSSLVIINMNFCSSVFSDSKLLLLYFNDLYKAFLSFAYNGHVVTKWSSSFISFLHMKHYSTAGGQDEIPPRKSPPLIHFFVLK